MDKAIKAIYERNGIKVEIEDEPNKMPIKKEKLTQICGICHEKKSIVAFGLTGEGGRKHLCTNCELDRMNSQEQPVIIGKTKGKPVLKFPDDKKKEEKPVSWRAKRADKSVEKMVAKKIGKDDREVKQIIKDMVDSKPEDKLIEEIEEVEIKKPVPTKKVIEGKWLGVKGESNLSILTTNKNKSKSRPKKKPKKVKPKQNLKTELPTQKLHKKLLDTEAKGLFKTVILSYLEKYEDGFTNLDIVNHLKNKRKSQWVYAKLSRMVRLGLLNVDKRRGINVYFLNEIVLKKNLPEKVEKERSELFTQKKSYEEAIEDKPLNKGVNGEDNFIKEVSKVADKMVINFNEKSTIIMVSPTHNILRVYDLLSDKQRETAEIVRGELKSIKFSWYI